MTNLKNTATRQKPNLEAETLLNEHRKRKQLLEEERHRYTILQLRLTNIVAQIKELEEKNDLTGIEELKLASLRASINELKEALRLIAEHMRRIEGRL